MKIKAFLVDSFTDEAFKGNPAGVCLLDQKISEELMQNIAMEVNAAETAFVVKDDSGDNKFFIRYYSPQVEIAFCGHATVASAKVLFEKNNFVKLAIKFSLDKWNEMPALLNEGYKKMAGLLINSPAGEKDL